MAIPSIRIEDVTFATIRTRRLATHSYPVGQATSPDRVSNRGLFFRTTAKGDLKIGLTITRLESAIKSIRIRALRSGPNRTIGDVRETVVTFRKDTETVTARVRQALAGAVVDAFPVRWDWFVRVENSQWQPVQYPAIWVYTTLGTPKAPWGIRRTKRLEIPWFEALDLACLWAKGARNIEEVCRLITQRLYNNGRLCYSPTDANYVTVLSNKWETFDLGELLKALTTNIGNGLFCSDAASTVCTLANLLGANLYEDKMDSRRSTNFETMSVRSMGASDAKPHSFPWHEVAWNKPGKEAQAIWDSCFSRVTPHADRLPVHILFRDYRRLMIASKDQRFVRPDHRRPQQRPLVKPESIALVPIDYKSSPLSRLKLAQWRLERRRVVILSADMSKENSVWVGTRDRKRLRLCIQVVTCKTSDQTKRALTQLIKVCPWPLASLTDWTLWDEAYGFATEPELETLIYFRTGNVIVRVSSTGLKTVPIRKQAIAAAQVVLNRRVPSADLRST